jgi:hypothetical protein
MHQVGMFFLTRARAQVTWLLSLGSLVLVLVLMMRVVCACQE